MQGYTGILLLLLIIISSCRNQEKAAVISANGVWESIGYGWTLHIKDSSEYVFYDITSISCVPNVHGDFTDIEESLQLNGDTLSLSGKVITHDFIKSNHLPKLCQDTIKNKSTDPLFNFEVFMETVKEHYAFLALNEINWEAFYQMQKGKLTAESSEADLYLLLEETFEKLHDNHSFLEGTDEVYEELDKLPEEESETEEDLPELGDFVVAKMVAEHHLEEDMTKDSWLMHWGKLTKDIGFIQVKSMWLYADLDIPPALIDEVGYVDAYVDTFHKMYDGDYVKKEVEAVGKIMDQVMNDLSSTKAIVIDLRFNGGGQDAVSFEILSHFFAGKLQVATQKVRYGNRHTPAFPLIIESSKKEYTNALYVLTSGQTGSAAESFALATMELKKAKRIGSASTGAMSTALEKKLPNGWMFSLSNEIIMDNAGISYENVGVPVDYELNYPAGRQPFFHHVANNLKADKQRILKAIAALERENQ